ncbi:metallophosphoesterase [Erwiniaceae bacterium BAC15a-03b]|uniref:Metallophosphoesterase n=1 Tax=Winslowiella arboricola TaxID=2978220 RepID=A0A9J6PZ96_9GAMM|nr:metallophosphoesterase [Winslowiella arboricola]MCU5775823.1 metallophosphoesterase [Winslowiella arboricola]MCU5779327.1 metallophosphoesterase [Winslowiella arboricola]
MMYQYLNGENWRHIYIVGDLHGCRGLLDQQLIANHFDTEQDLLVSVGDMIDRGPDSLACLALLNEPWFRCVLGNHEAMALAAITTGERDLWEMNGGNWFYRLSGAALVTARHALNQCRDLPLILHLTLEDRIAVVAHADYPAEHYAWEQQVDADKVVWSRDRINQLQRGRGAVISGADDFYFGHTPLKNPLHAWNQHFIDTGAVFGNRLTLVQLQ